MSRPHHPKPTATTQPPPPRSTKIHRGAAASTPAAASWTTRGAVVAAAAVPEPLRRMIQQAACWATTSSAAAVLPHAPVRAAPPLRVLPSSPNNNSRSSKKEAPPAEDPPRPRYDDSNKDIVLLDLTNSEDDDDILQVWTSPSSSRKRRSCSQEQNDDTDDDTDTTTATQHHSHDSHNNTRPSTAHKKNDSATEEHHETHDDAVAQVRRYQELHLQRNLQYTLQQFVQELWNAAEDDLGASTAYLEDCKSGLRRANHIVHASESTVQAGAQYGRLEFLGTQTVLHQILQLDSAHDVLVDIGSGIGNVVLQAAYVHQCAARGLEVVELRHVTATAFRDKLAVVHQLHRARDGLDYRIGPVDLRRGSLQEAPWRAFLTDPAPRTRIKAFCNNYNDVFGEKAVKMAHAKKGWTLDRYTAGLLAGMPPESVLLTLHPLPIPIAPQSQVAQLRKRAGLVSNNNNNNELNASFYELERVSLGPAKDLVSWASRDGELWGYKYTRVVQPQQPQAVFLCTNPDCRTARQGTPIPATERRFELQERLEVVVVRSGCPDCGGCAKHTFGQDRSLRTRCRTTTTTTTSP